MTRCTLCGETRKHAMHCPNPDGEPQRRASLSYFRYLSRTEDGGELRWTFLRWLRYMVTNRMWPSDSVGGDDYGTWGTTRERL